MTESPEVAEIMRRAAEYAAITRDTALEPDSDELMDSDLIADFRITLEGFIRRLVAERDAYKAGAERLAGQLEQAMTLAERATVATTGLIPCTCPVHAPAAHDARQQEQAE